MFVSQKAAKERLASKQNVFREEHSSGAPDSTPAPEVLPEVLPEEKPESAPRGRVGLVGPPLLDIQRMNSLVFREGEQGFDHKWKYAGNDEAKLTIAKTAILVGKREAAQTFGISEESVRTYTRDLPEEKKDELNEFRKELSMKAAQRLGETLELLDGEKLSKVKRATNLSKIAKDMASIVEKVTPKDSGDAGGVHFHIYKPEMNVEQNYKVVNVGSSIDRE